jgi:hypothetical protein
MCRGLLLQPARATVAFRDDRARLSPVYASTSPPPSTPRAELSERRRPDDLDGDPRGPETIVDDPRDAWSRAPSLVGITNAEK